ncbi:MAG: HAMP domain-containing histidine kinase [Collinsella intestinalis]|nr:HAMP domain-containing histidine kinase [Collinsella intestinalis]
MLRNREIRRALIACLLITALGTVATYLVTRSIMLDALGGARIVTASINEAASMVTSGASVASAALFAAICTFVTGLIVTVIFIILTNRRYRALAKMAANLDRVLAGERDIRLRDMSEGELAILSSEIDKVIARLNLTVDELQAEKLALSDALADISHQLKTPLTSIAISTELIRDRLSARGDSEDLVERLRLIQTLQARVEDLVSALLKLARIDAGVIKLVCGDVDARELVRKSFEPLAIAFDIADVRFSADVQDGASYEGDLTWSVEALENILKNCMEHTPAGGCVSVRVTEDVLACRIRIEDTGPGIAESDLPHIFERFYRGSRDANATPSEVNPAGVGIGLALSKSLVTAQGGTLTAENLRDENGNITGAAFNLVFFKTVV